MDKKVIEGITYVPQAAMQAAMEERIKKLSADRVAAEDRAKELQSQLDTMQGKLGTLDTLASQVEQYKSQLEEANTRYTRHTSMADHGWTDPDLRDGVEWAYSKAMNGRAKKYVVSFSDWLGEIKQDPTKAPALLRPHIQAPQTAEAPEATEAQIEQPEAPVLIPPSTNTGVKPSPVRSSDIIERGMQDLDFYRANREAIAKAWKQK